MSGRLSLEDPDELGNYPELLLLVLRTEHHRLELRVKRLKADRDMTPLVVTGGQFFVWVNFYRVFRARVGRAQAPHQQTPSPPAPLHSPQVKAQAFSCG